MNINYLRVRYLVYCFFVRNVKKKGDWLRKHHVFAEVGENVRFGPWIIPSDASHITLHNNVIIASGVSLMCHDGVNLLLSNMADHSYLKEGEQIPITHSPIEICDNVYIGAESIICPGVKIGENTIIAAGSVVMNHIPPNSIAGGNPAKVIGKFSFLANMRVDKYRKKGLIKSSVTADRL